MARSGVVVVVVMVVFMVISSGVDVGSELIEGRIGRREGECGGFFDAFRCARTSERQLFAGDVAVRLQPRFEQRDRIARFPLRQLGRIDVRLVVRFHVAAQAIGVRLQEVRLAIRADVRNRFARGSGNGVDVIAVDR